MNLEAYQSYLRLLENADPTLKQTLKKLKLDSFSSNAKTLLNIVCYAIGLTA